MQRYYNYIPTRYRSPILTALSIVVFAVIGYYVFKRLKEKEAGEGWRGADGEKKTQVSGPKPRPGFSPKNEVSKIFALLNTWWDSADEDKQAFSYILSYNDNELIEVHNAWRIEASNDFWKYKTLRQQVQAEWIIGRQEIENLRIEVIKRLDFLGL